MIFNIVGMWDKNNRQRINLKASLTEHTVNISGLAYKLAQTFDT
jgi:hypothetical protein